MSILNNGTLTIDSIRLKRATAAVLTAANPLLGEGEPAIETDTGRIKIGDGVKYWNDLSYSDIRYAVATAAVSGLMSTEDKAKLDSIPTDGTMGQILKVNSQGFMEWGEEFAYTHPTYTAYTGNPTDNLTPGFGDAVTISQIATNTLGHVTGMTGRSITIPNATATTSSAGLMSPGDKEKLEGIASGANAYTHPTYDATTGAETGNQTPGFGESFNLSQIISDSSGHLTSQTTRTVTIPSTAASTTTSGIVKLSNSYNSDSEATAATSKALNDLRVLIFGISDTSSISTSFDTLKEVADYLAGHGSVVQGFTDDISALQNLAVDMIGATSTDEGAHGFAPAPAAGDQTKFLRGDATWAVPYTHPSYTSLTGKPDGNATPAFGGTFTVSQISSDSTGHVQSLTERTITIPSTVATTSLAGLMSATDKSRLDGMATGATANSASTTTPLANGTASAGSESAYARGDHVHPLQTTISGNAATATTLETSRTIDGVSFNGSAAIIHYGTCSTEAATVAKKVSCTGFTLVTGAWIMVKMAVTNTGAVGSLTLNVNSTGAKSIKYRDGNLPSADTLTAGRTYLFIYDGSNYQLVGDLDTNVVYTHPTTSGNKHIPSGGSSGQILRWSADGTAAWGDDNNTTCSNMIGASTGAAGTSGLVPAPEKGAATRYLRSDGTWQVPPDTDTVYTHPTYTSRTGKPTANQTPKFGGTVTISQVTSDATGHVTGMTDRTITIPSAAATTSSAGLMSATDKSRLDSLCIWEGL